MASAQVLASWQREHENFNFLLGFVDRNLALAHQWTRADFDLLVDVVAHLNFFRDRYHCSREQTAFALVAQKYPEMVRIVDRLGLEHRVIAAKGQKAYDLLSESTGAATPRSLMELKKYVRYFRRHIEREELSMLPRALGTLTDSEWKLVQDSAPPGPEPFRLYSRRRHEPNFGDEAAENYRMLCDRISRASERPRRGVLAKRKSVKSASAIPAGTAASGSLLLRSADRSGRKRTDIPRKFAGHIVPWVLASLSWHRKAALLLALVLSYLNYYFLDVHLEILQLPAIVFYFFNWTAGAPVAS